MKINKFLNFFQFQKPKIGNFGIIRLFDIFQFSQFCLFSYFPSDINQFFQFLFPVLVTHKFDRSTFERSLILKFETLAILKFYSLKFTPPSYFCKL